MDTIKVLEKFNEAIETDTKNILVLLKNDNFIIGKHNNGICFVIRSQGGQKKKYKNGDMSIHLNASYFLGKEIGNYSVIFYSNKDERKIKIFIETMVNSVGNQNLDSDTLFSLYEDISEVFKSIPFDYSLFVGTLGELLFIKYVYDVCKINMVSYYQSATKHLVDFKYEDFIIEIKTTSSNDRKHVINNDQLRGKGFLCSIKVYEDNTGKSMLDLFSEIENLFVNNNIRLSYIQNYILSIPPKQLSEKFNMNYENLKFFNCESIPKINNYPDSISNIKFTLNFSNIENYDMQDIFFKK